MQSFLHQLARAFKSSHAAQSEVVQGNKWSVGILMAICLLASGTPAAKAEGSRTLYPAGATGNRANIEWRTNQYGSLVLRRTLLKVYAKKDEYILVGSSAMNVNKGEIMIFDPGRVSGAIGAETIPGTPDFKCSDQPSGQGQITSRTQELAGPNSITGNNNPTGYTPCYYQAPSTGIYDVVITGTDGLDSSRDGSVAGDISLSSGNNFSNQQKGSVAAWDVTVRDSQTSTVDRNGRLFAYYYALSTGGNGRPLNFPTYPVTSDGFRYKMELRGADPNGFLLYGNQVGFFDSDGKTPLYHDVNGDGFEILNPEGGVSFSNPQYPTFLNPVDPDVLGSIQRYRADGSFDGVGIPLIPTVPTVNGLSFTGTASGNTSTQGTGGNFQFNTNVSGNYQIVISRDGVNFDPTNPLNRVLRGTMITNGVQTVTWNGQDNSGNNFPVGTNYPANVQIHAGEYHFPFIDGENNFYGGPTITLLNGANPLGNTTAFFDDRGYRTLNGTVVGKGNTDAEKLANALCGSNPPNPAFSDPILGFDTTTNARKFGGASGGNSNTKCRGAFGDTKGLDLWTYFPSGASSTQLNIIGPVDISGTIWNDIDNSANNTFSNIQNGAEVGTDAGGLHAILVDSSGNVLATSSVAANGTYSFLGLASNQNDLSIRLSPTAGTIGQPAPTASLPNGWTNTSPLATATFNIGTADVTERDFGIKPSAPELLLVKRITAINGQPIDFYDDDTTSSKQAEDNHPNWPTPLNANSANGSTVMSEFLKGRINAGTVKSNDVLQYTIYFLSSGKSAAKNINFCDLVPANTTFLPTTFSAMSGIELVIGNTAFALTNVPDGDRGEYFQPGAIPSMNCSGINSNGAVAVQIVRNSDAAPNNELPAATAPGTPNNAYGYVRFEVKVN
ncbi:hypothetical protein IQ266_10140 [filamentous cyanobacterium LEGE 11480]|uniref:DUF11 domain-containing protein n=1 Tax=Romeriopsis navalis LEGE 11480 TaxID=2777977 RepID=A0A928VLZ9_9CYAN|nr:hypothetical protein [Romeriopsis navalis]MBE9030087.1 hypothetical protein [Romeriopsis navalis LEGE 11480]